MSALGAEGCSFLGRMCSTWGFITFVASLLYCEVEHNSFTNHKSRARLVFFVWDKSYSHNAEVVLLVLGSGLTLSKVEIYVVVDVVGLW